MNVCIQYACLKARTKVYACQFVAIAINVILRYFVIYIYYLNVQLYQISFSLQVLL